MTKRIMVVDDEVHIREIVQTCLEAMGGWEVITAASGLEGLVKVGGYELDAIILDVMMPEMDGLSFLAQLKHHSFTVPVILLTAKANLTRPQQFPTLGIAGAIAKPFNPMLLADQIARILQWI
jgi:CheY-like chemotaxis protein